MAQTCPRTYERIHADSKVTGQHSSDNVATFLQYDHKFIDRLNVSVGVRLEYYRVDDFYREAETKIFGAKVPVKPVFRGGLNYELGEYSFIRASFGQGYRYPSVTEKFILKDIGGVGAFPNAELKAEQGYNAELGFKQGYKFGNLKGFIDVAGFYTRYKDMIEFRFGLFNNKTFDYIDGLSKLFNAFSSGDGLGIGAQFTNVGRAEIYGVDLSTSGVYEFNRDTRLAYTLGYVYTNPIDMDVDSRNAEEEANDDLMAMRSKSNDSKYLKYRQKHSVKGVFDLEWKQFNIGTNMSWKSKTLAVDYFMVDERTKAEPNLMDYMRSMLFGNLHDYWAENNKGYFVMDMRVGMKVTKNIHVQGLVNNLLNKRYSVQDVGHGAGQQAGVVGVLHPDLAHHLAHDDLDVLIVDVHALLAVHLQDLLDQVVVHGGGAADPQHVVGVQGAVLQLFALFDDVAVTDLQAGVGHGIGAGVAVVGGDDDVQQTALGGLLEADLAADLGQSGHLLGLAGLEQFLHAGTSLWHHCGE